MGKGANYLNNNKGVYLQQNKKKTETMPMCQYGNGCRRPSCIYRHPTPKDPSFTRDQSNEPCMAFLAGMCAFEAKGCRKRHPPKAEVDRLVAKYKKTKCRYSEKCKTKGCLYRHPSDPVPEDDLSKQQQQQSNHYQQGYGWDSNNVQYVQPPQHVLHQYHQAQMYQQHQYFMQQQMYMQQQYYMQQQQQFHYMQQQQQQQQQFALQQQAMAINAEATEFVPKADAKEFVPGDAETPPPQVQPDPQQVEQP